MPDDTKIYTLKHSGEKVDEAITKALEFSDKPGTPGEKGEPGERGEQGLQGEPGEPGQDGINGDSAYQIWQNAGNIGSMQDFLDSLQGQRGADGAPGEKGDQGERGQDGAGIEISGSVPTFGDLPSDLTAADAGKSFLVMEDGLLYIWGGAAFPADGGGVEFRGPRGERGEQGEPGADGLPGEKGADGKSAYETWLTAGNTGNEADFLESLRGQDGVDGEKGEPGAQGEKGEPGAQGEPGIPEESLTGNITYYLSERSDPRLTTLLREIEQNAHRYKNARVRICPDLSEPETITTDYSFNLPAGIVSLTLTGEGRHLYHATTSRRILIYGHAACSAILESYPTGSANLWMFDFHTIQLSGNNVYSTHIGTGTLNFARINRLSIQDYFSSNGTLIVAYCSWVSISNEQLNPLQVATIRMYACTIYLDEVMLPATRPNDAYNGVLSVYGDTPRLDINNVKVTV
jgi:hypothetical protein